VTYSTRAGTEARLVRNGAERAAARSLVDAGVFWALRELLRPADAQRITADGTRYAIAFHGAQLHVAVQDEGGKVDLNGAAPALIEAVLAAAGAEPAAAHGIAQSIADWRDSDDDRRPGGAEAGDYAAAGLATGPRNAPFLILEELRAVRGMTPALFAAVSPLLTVHSGAGGVDPQTAPPPVLRALPGMTAAQATAVAETRYAGGSAAALPAAASTFIVGSARNTYTIEVEVDASEVPRLQRVALVALTGQPQRPYRILSWAEH
jgi:general secretion pathway protein K